ncbi:hypothetical protein BX600DRAFT_441336 [Xylariales sp. PMI_506]|nr:hypothetical protein BX600DRAFT_441336 [Xylariales sp. PMI_506]
MNRLCSGTSRIVMVGNQAVGEFFEDVEMLRIRIKHGGTFKIGQHEGSLGAAQSQLLTPFSSTSSIPTLPPNDNFCISNMDSSLFPRTLPLSLSTAYQIHPSGNSSACIYFAPLVTDPDYFPIRLGSCAAVGDYGQWQFTEDDSGNANTAQRLDFIENDNLSYSVIMGPSNDSYYNQHWMPAGPDLEHVQFGNYGYPNSLLTYSSVMQGVIGVMIENSTTVDSGSSTWIIDTGHDDDAADGLTSATSITLNSATQTTTVSLDAMATVNNSPSSESTATITTAPPLGTNSADGSSLTDPTHVSSSNTATAPTNLAGNKSLIIGIALASGVSALGILGMGFGLVQRRRRQKKKKMLRRGSQSFVKDITIVDIDQKPTVCRGVLDTGCQAGDWISKTRVERLGLLDEISPYNPGFQPCSIQDEEVSHEGTIKLQWRLPAENKYRKSVFNVGRFECTDLLIGRATITSENLLSDNTGIIATLIRAKKSTKKEKQDAERSEKERQSEKAKHEQMKRDARRKGNDDFQDEISRQN